MDGSYHKEPPLSLLCKCKRKDSSAFQSYLTVQSTRGPGLSVSKPPPLRVEMELSPTFCTTPQLPTGPCLPRVPGLTQIPGVAHTTITEQWIRCPVSQAFYIQQVPSPQYICPSLPSEVMGNMPLPSPSHVQQLSAPQPFSDVGEVISNIQFPETAFQYMHPFALVPHVQQLPSPQSSAVGLPPSPKMVSRGLGSA